MSSSNRPSPPVETEPSAVVAAQLLRERIGQENVAQSSVLASRRLDEALSRLERVSTIHRNAETVPVSEQAHPLSKSEPAIQSDDAAKRERSRLASDDFSQHADEMSSDAIESLFGRPIDVMILSTKAKINEDRVFKPSVAPEVAESLGGAEPGPREQPSPVAEPRTVAPNPVAAAPVGESDTDKTPDRPQRVVFNAAWQVDEFLVPSTIDQLFLADSLAEQLAKRLTEARSEGLRTIAVTSTAPGEGRSTVAMGLALSIAFSGIRVALIDADRNGGKIASNLQLDLDHSWPEAIRSNMPLEEIAVESQADSLTLLPLLDRDGGAEFTPAELQQMLTRLRQSFDMIVVDCGPSAIDEIVLCGTALIVRDEQRTDVGEMEDLAQTMRQRGVLGVGVIENFCV